MSQPEQICYYGNLIQRQPFFFARTVRSRGILHVFGCTGMDKEGNLAGSGDMLAQLRQIYTTLAEILRVHELTFQSVIKETIYTTDMAALMRAGHIRMQAYSGFAPPAVTGLEVSALVRPELHVEVEVIAELTDVH